MDGKKVLAVSSIYREYLYRTRVSKIDYPPSERVLYRNDILRHCNKMIDRMEEFVRQGRMDKAFRWLGFVQGCLWSTGCHTLDDLKHHSRPDQGRHEEGASEIRKEWLDLQSEIADYQERINNLKFREKEIQIKCPHSNTIKTRILDVQTEACEDCGLNRIDRVWRFHDK